MWCEFNGVVVSFGVVYSFFFMIISYRNGG